MQPKHRALFAALAFLLASCGKSPQQWINDGKDQARMGNPLQAVDDYDHALAQDGPWRGRALFFKAQALMDLRRYQEAARCAEDSTQGQSSTDARDARVLALQALAAAGDAASGARILALLGGRAALEDPEVAAAAAKLGLNGGDAAKPAAAAAEPHAAPPATYAARSAAPASAGAVAFSQLDAVRLSISKVSRSDAMDPASYPLRVEFQDPRVVVKVPSPDGTMAVWRGQDHQGYWLYLSAHGTVRRLDACKNGYQPAWSPDSKRILFSAMDWRLVERNLFIYDVASNKSRRAFNARRKVGPLASWSPDGSKIVFVYYDDLWVMNSDGIGRSLLNLKDRIGKPIRDAQEIGWSRDGRRLAYRMRGDNSVYCLELAPKL